MYILPLSILYILASRWLNGKELTYNQLPDRGNSIPELRRLWRGNGNPLPYSATEENLDKRISWGWSNGTSKVEPEFSNWTENNSHHQCQDHSFWGQWNIIDLNSFILVMMKQEAWGGEEFNLRSQRQGCSTLSGPIPLTWLLLKSLVCLTLSTPWTAAHRLPI